MNDHDHSFYRTNAETRTAVLRRDGDTDTVIAGFHGLTVLKTTESGFEGYPKDRYTTLKETNDRILVDRHRDPVKVQHRRRRLQREPTPTSRRSSWTSRPMSSR